MFRVIFLILIAMSAIAFAQTEEKAPKDLPPEPIKFDEFGKATNGNVKMRMQAFFIEMNNNPTSQAYIVNYGTDREIAIRERQIRNAINFFKLDAFRLTLARGGFLSEFKTEFWLVPPGAETPQLTSNGEKFGEFGEASIGDIKARLDGLYTELNNSPNSRGYILNYGLKNQIIARETLIRKYIAFLKLDLSRVTIRKAGSNNSNNGVKTEFWIVSAAAKTFIPKKDATDTEGKAPATVKLEEFERSTNGYVKIKIHRFFKELKDNPKSQGYIINYGTAKEIAKRSTQIKDAIGFFKYDPSKVTLIRGGTRKVIKTQFWVVPAGAEPPKP